MGRQFFLLFSGEVVKCTSVTRGYKLYVAKVLASEKIDCVYMCMDDSAR